MSQLPRTCSDLHDILGAYSLGATTSEENRAIEALLPNCPEAAEELAGYIAVRDSLTRLVVTPADEPPPDLLAGLPDNDALRRYPISSERSATPHEKTIGRLRPPQPQRERTFSPVKWVTLGGVVAALLITFGMLVVVNQMRRELQTQRNQLTALMKNASATGNFGPENVH